MYYCVIIIHVYEILVLTLTSTIVFVHYAFPVYYEHSLNVIIESVQDKLRALFEVDNDAEVRLWQRYMTNSYELMKDTSQTLADVGIYGGQVSM